MKKWFDNAVYVDQEKGTDKVLWFMQRQFPSAKFSMVYPIALVYVL